MSGASESDGGPRGFRRLARFFPFPVRLALVVLAGALVQAYVALVTTIGPDEGNYLSGAAAIALGQTPFVDFPTRDPGIMYYLAIGARIFGPSMEVARLQMVLLSAGTAVFLALLARRLASREGARIALLAAGLFLFVPYDVEFGTEIHLESLAMFLLAAMAFVLLREYPRRRNIDLVLAGVLLAFAVLTRQSAGIISVPFALYLAWTAPTWGARFREVLLYVGTMLAVAGGFSLYIIERTSFTWYWEEMVVPPTAYSRPSSFPEVLSLVPYTWMVGAVLLLAPLVLVVVLVVERPFPRWLKALTVGVSTAGVVAMLAIFPSIANRNAGVVGELGANGALFAGEIELAAILVALWAVLVLVALRWRGPGSPFSLSITACLAGWGLFFVGTDFTVRQFGTAPYLYDATGPASLLLAGWLVSLRSSRRPATAPATPTSRPGPEGARVRGPPLGQSTAVSGALVLTLTALLVVPSALGAVLVLGPTNPINEAGYYAEPSTNPVSPAVLASVSSWIRSHVPHNESIFSVDDVYITEAGRLSTPNLNIDSSPYFRYPFPSNQSPYAPDPFGLMPSATQLVKLWNQSRLSFLVEGPRTERMMALQPMVGWYFETTFHPAQMFGDAPEGTQVTIWERGRMPTTQSVNWVENWTSLRSPSTVAYDPATGTLVAAGLASGDLGLIAPNGTFSAVNLRGVGSIAQVAAGNGSVWVQPAVSGKLGLFSLRSDTFQFVATGLFAAVDPVPNAVTGEVYVLSPAQHLVAAFDAQGIPAWNQTVACTPSLSVLLASPSGLLVTCLDSPSAFLLNPTNGHEVSSMQLQPGLTSLVALPGEVVGANASGGLSAWNTTSWSLVREDPSASALPPLMTFPGTHDVLSMVPANGGNFSNLVAVDGNTLVPVGNFSTHVQLNDFVFRGATPVLLESVAKPQRLALVGLPSPASVTVHAPPGSSLTFNGVPLGTQHLQVWPGVYYFGVAAPGYIPGEQTTAVAPGQTSASVTVELGPEISALGPIQFWFLVEVSVLSVIAFVALNLFLYPSPPIDGDAPPDRGASTSAGPSPGPSVRDEKASP